MHRTRDIFRRLFKCCFCPKTLNPKKSAKKEARISFPPSHYPPQITQRFIRKRYIIFVLSLVLSLSLSLSLSSVCLFRNALCIYSCFGLESALSSGAKEERRTHHIYHIYQSGKRDLDWIDPGKKRVSEECLERGRKIEERKCKRKQNAHIISEKEKNGVPNLDRV